MDEEELVPGIDGQTFEIRLGEGFRVGNEVIPAPQQEVEVENNTMLEAFLEIQNERLQELNDNGLRLHEELAQAVRDMPVPVGREEMQRAYVRDLENYIQQTREQALNTLGINQDRVGELRPAVNDANVEIFNQVQNELENEIGEFFNDNNNYIPVEAQPLADLNRQAVGRETRVQGENGEFTYDMPIRQNIIEELEAQRGHGLEARLDAERQPEQLRGMATQAGMLHLNTERPPVQNIQEINLETEQAVGRVTREHLENAVNTVYYGRDLTGAATEAINLEQAETVTRRYTGRGVEAFTTEVREVPNAVPGGEYIRHVEGTITTGTRRTGATQARPLSDVIWAEEAVPTRMQRLETWGEPTWKDPNEERIRKVENLKKELMEFIGTLEESDSIKKIQEYVDRY